MFFLSRDALKVFLQEHELNITDKSRSSSRHSKFKKRKISSVSPKRGFGQTSSNLWD